MPLRAQIPPPRITLPSLTTSIHIIWSADKPVGVDETVTEVEPRARPELMLLVVRPLLSGRPMPDLLKNSWPSSVFPLNRRVVAGTPLESVDPRNVISFLLILKLEV